MKASKLPSGNWRVQVYLGRDENGKVMLHSVTAPTKAEALLAASQISARPKSVKKIGNETVGEVVDKYIELNEILSPSTIRGYKSIREHYFSQLMATKVRTLDNEMMQLAVNLECKRQTERGQISAKTIKNGYGLISSALKSVCNLTFEVKLPKIAKKPKELPDPALVLNAIIGTDIELPCLLAMWLSFTMSEVRGIKCSDIKNGTVALNRVRIRLGSEDVVKEIGKAENRLRMHKLPDYIMDLIRSCEVYQSYIKTGTDDYLIPDSRSRIYGRLETIGKEHGFKLSFHELRHLNASVMLMLNIPEKYAMERGGWKTPDTMKKVYEHTFSAERIAVDSKVNSYFENIIKNVNTDSPGILQ